MKEIYASCGIWEKLFLAGVDSACTITGYDFNLFWFFRRQELAEFGEDIVPMIFMDPYDTILIHVINHGDVLVALPVGGLIHTDTAYIIMDALGNIRLKACMGCFDTVTYCSPVDA